MGVGVDVNTKVEQHTIMMLGITLGIIVALGIFLSKVGK
jgi:hypothetical protein